ncbi:hypothetical protein CANCADRAFT_57530 [Tortispora caseinolytica NRRL Y-17796]|uniref:Uncharacterized protein n=1 Tax=Tortispora caseinolytica NRRL Y-17796 TaxID=767744 RepID=A0A1E4THN1_9ASCO|nr:hypothetical protein CANCADRAFT_57530 [Tortispora caseinolytica NRRL Y-17796]
MEAPYSNPTFLYDLTFVLTSLSIDRLSDIESNLAHFLSSSYAPVDLFHISLTSRLISSYKKAHKFSVGYTKSIITEYVRTPPFTSCSYSRDNSYSDRLLGPYPAIQPAAGPTSQEATNNIRLSSFHYEFISVIQFS